MSGADNGCLFPSTESASFRAEHRLPSRFPVQSIVLMFASRPWLKYLTIGLGSLAAVLIVLFAAFFVYYRFIYEMPSECIQGDCENGTGILVYENGTRYSGQFQDGESHGFGTFVNPRGDRYEGAWVQGEKHGYGVYVYPGGGKYSGEFHHNVKHGFGSYTWSDGTKYTGRWNEGEPHGDGAVELTDGTRLEGTYENGIVVEGAGIYIYDDGKRYIGQWKDGKRNGVGVMLDDHGGLIWAGRWENDERGEQADFMQRGTGGAQDDGAQDDAGDESKTLR